MAGGLLWVFPRLRAGTFIEARIVNLKPRRVLHFPAFGRGLSLRPTSRGVCYVLLVAFPRLRAGTFIEAVPVLVTASGTLENFPAFGRGLSLRRVARYPAP